MNMSSRICGELDNLGVVDICSNMVWTSLDSSVMRGFDCLRSMNCRICVMDQKISRVEVRWESRSF